MTSRTIRPPPFLRDPDAAFRWAKRYADLDLDTEDDDDVDNARRLARLYSNFANSVCSSGRVIVYRTIAIPSVFTWREGVRLKCLGKAWSAEGGCADVYGMVPHGIPTRKVTMVGIAAASTIDWQYGFTSFMYYGESQWEVSLKSRKTVLLTEVDGERLDPPLRGSTGDARESWEDCQ